MSLAGADGNGPRPETLICDLANTVVDRARMVVYLESVDSLFTIPLSARVDLGAYAGKLLQHGIVRVAMQDGRIVGIVGFYANDLQDGEAYLSLVAVSRDTQGRGLGTRLVASALATAVERGMRRMRLEVYHANTRAQALYARLGFQPSASRQDGDPPEASIYMERRLGPVQGDIPISRGRGDAPPANGRRKK